jgi:hypothetical protein
MFSQPEFEEVIIYPNDSVDVFEKLELRFLMKHYSNNYDSEIVKVDAIFASPTGKTYTVPGFYYIDYVKLPDFDCGLDLPCESLAVAKWQPYNWIVRFTPNEIGIWTFKVIIEDNNGKRILAGKQDSSFICNRSDKSGFISKRNKRYLQKGDQPIFLVGTNVCWYGRDVFSKPIANELGTNDYIRYFDILEENKANFTKVWINHSPSISLTGREWTTNKVHGFDEYNQKDAWQLDRIFELAETRNINIILCLFQQNALVNTYGINNWKKNNAFNIEVNSNRENTIDSPFLFFSDAISKKKTKDLIRYMIARWGYATNLVAWKIFTEIEQVENIWSKSNITPQRGYLESVFDWHSEMAEYIREIDAFNHLITTSSPNKYSNGGKEYPRVFYDMDLTISHDYKSVNTLNERKVFEKHLQVRANTYINEKGLQDKPYMSQEWGVTPGRELTGIDPVGYAFHNCLWSSAMSGAFGSVMSWEWDTYLLKKDLFKRLKPIAEFMDSVIDELDGSIIGKRTYGNGISTFYAVNRSNGLVIGWCQDDNYDYAAVKNTAYIKNLKKSKPKVSCRNNTIEITIADNKGFYKIRWYDTSTANLVEESFVKSKRGTLKFEMPVSLRTSTFGDGAFKLIPAE